MASRVITLFAIQLLAVSSVAAVDPPAAAQPDLSCTELNSTVYTYTERALVCKDAQSSATCAIMFPPAAAGDVLAAGTDKARPVKCHTLAGVDSKEQKKFALENCASHCGFCCLTPAYNCENSPNPIHFNKGCQEVTQERCRDPEYKQLITRDCPNVCGFCQEDGCKDAITTCDYSMCNNINNQDFVKKNCIKTCGLCSNSPVVSATTPAGNTVATMGPGPVVTGATGGPITVCFDKHKNCAAWARNGYCTNPFYTNADRVKYCPVTCGLCSMLGK